MRKLFYAFFCCSLLFSRNGYSQMTITPLTNSYICLSGSGLIHFQVSVPSIIGTTPQQIHLSAATQNAGIEDMLGTGFGINMRNIVVHNYPNSVQNLSTIDFDIEFLSLEAPYVGEGFAIATTAGSQEFIFKNIGSGLANKSIVTTVNGTDGSSTADNLSSINIGWGAWPNYKISFPNLIEGNATILNYAIQLPSGWQIDHTTNGASTTSDGNTPLMTTNSFVITKYVQPADPNNPGQVSISAVTTCGNIFLKSIPIIVGKDPACMCPPISPTPPVKCIVCGPTHPFSLSVSPNPSSSHINIATKSRNDYLKDNPTDSVAKQLPTKIVSYKIYNSGGDLIQSMNNINAPNYNINTINLKRGIYYIDILTDKGLEREKFFKQ